MSSADAKQERIDRVSKLAGDYEVLSRNCAQSTAIALCEEFNVEGGKEAIRGCSFMPGVAATRETCGALLGGMMALGLALGRDHLADPVWKEPAVNDAWLDLRRKIRAYVKAFEAEFGSTRCGVIRPLIMGRDYDSLDPVDRQQFAADGGVEKCRVPPEVAARLAAKLLLELED